jgi:hypothetical protein
MDTERLLAITKRRCETLASSRKAAKKSRKQSRRNMRRNEVASRVLRFVFGEYVAAQGIAAAKGLSTNIQSCVSVNEFLA